MFKLDSRLEADTYWLGDLPLCRVLLARDANYPWLILVPKVDGAREIIDLEKADQSSLFEESLLISRLLNEILTPDKLNVAALGNVVEQLHVHHIARYREDACWPKPVWGQVAAKAYSDNERDALLAQLNLGSLSGFQSAPDL